MTDLGLRIPISFTSPLFLWFQQVWRPSLNIHIIKHLPTSWNKPCATDSSGWTNSLQIFGEQVHLAVYFLWQSVISIPAESMPCSRRNMWTANQAIPSKKRNERENLETWREVTKKQTQAVTPSTNLQLHYIYTYIVYINIHILPSCCNRNGIISICFLSVSSERDTRNDSMFWLQNFRVLIHAGPFSTDFLFRSTPCRQLHHASLTLALGASGISHLEESPNPQKVACRTHHAWRSICKDKSVYIHNITQDYGQYMIWRYIFNHGYCREMMPNDGEQPAAEVEDGHFWFNEPPQKYPPWN